MQDEIYTDNPSEAELNFHYKREERLKDAPTVVQKYYAGELPTAPKGLFKALVHTKASRFTFIALILVLALFVALVAPFLSTTSFILSSSPVERLLGSKYSEELLTKSSSALS